MPKDSGYTKKGHGYLKPKGQTTKELDKASKPYDSNKRMGGDNANYETKKNPIDAEMDKLQDEEDERMGITQTLKNVWDAYTD